MLALMTLVAPAGVANIAAVALPGAIGMRIARATVATAIAFFSMSWFKPYFFNSPDEFAAEGGWALCALVLPSGSLPR